MNIPLNVSRFLDVFSGDGDGRQQALGQLFEKMKAHKKIFPCAYPMKSPQAPPGVPWVSPMLTDEAGVLVTPGESTEHEPTPAEEAGVQVTPEPVEQEP
eukprot:7282145-Karenia_brevis.AAC.1